jgi:hypothetical protein
MTSKSGKLLFVILLGCTLSGCIPPDSKVVQWLISPKINNYRIESIALLPLKKDDTTSTGTFYSTNYFLKSLKENYPNYKFEVLDIGQALLSDSLIVEKAIESIELKHKADLKNLDTTEMGDSLRLINVDVIILGRINNPSKNLRFWIEPGFVTMASWSTGCNFTYYMVSLKDGRVLWMSNVLGTANYQEEVEYSWDYEKNLYPPLDMAISNGIDKIINTLPLKKHYSYEY